MRKNIARPQTFQRSRNRSALRQQPAHAQGARKAMRLKIRRQSNRTRTFLNTRHAQRSSLPANRQQPNGRAIQVRTGGKRNAKCEVCAARPESQTSSFWTCDTDPNVELKCERNPPCPISDNSYFPESPHFNGPNQLHVATRGNASTAVFTAPPRGEPAYLSAHGHTRDQSTAKGRGQFSLALLQRLIAPSLGTAQMASIPPPAEKQSRRLHVRRAASPAWPTRFDLTSVDRLPS